MSVTGKRADTIELGDRLAVPGTEITFPVRFIHRKGDSIIFELASEQTMTVQADDVLRVAS